MQKNPLFEKIPSYSASFKWNTKIPAATQKTATGFIFIFAHEDKKKIQALIKKQAPLWQQKSLLEGPREVIHFVGKLGPLWILCHKRKLGTGAHGGRLEESIYSWHRDQVGTLVSFFKAYHLKNISMEFYGSEHDHCFA